MSSCLIEQTPSQLLFIFFYSTEGQQNSTSQYAPAPKKWQYALIYCESKNVSHAVELMMRGLHPTDQVQFVTLLILSYCFPMFLHNVTYYSGEDTLSQETLGTAIKSVIFG